MENRLSIVHEDPEQENDISRCRAIRYSFGIVSLVNLYLIVYSQYMSMIAGVFNYRSKIRD